MENYTCFPFLILFLVILCTRLSVAEDTIKFAAVLYRHGDRTPADSYPTDPWRNESFWPVRFGQLTNTGKQQHYELGKWLRKRYAHLLSSQFDPKEIYVRSTDVDRTLMSAQANLAGMYPPVGKSIWNNLLMWQPIPIHTKPEKDDAVLAMKKKCVAYNKEMEKMEQSKAFKQRLSQYQSLMDYLTMHTGRKIKTYYDIEDIYNILYIETLYNFTLPNWTGSVYPDMMVEPACYSFSTSAATPLLARLRAGPLLKEIIETMTMSATKKDSSLKLIMYSAHDFTVGTVLRALGMFDGQCPVYTATILLELIEDDLTKTQYIRISYRNSTQIVEPHVLSIPHCGQKCPVEKFKRLYENLLTVDFDYDCDKQFTAWLGVSFFGGHLIFATIYIMYLHRLHFTRRTSQNGSLNEPSSCVKHLKTGATHV